jgi:hypothetical protein
VAKEERLTHRSDGKETLYTSGWTRRRYGVLEREGQLRSSDFEVM